MTPRVLQFHYTLRNADGRVLDTSRGDTPLACVEGAGQIVPGLEKVLRSMQPGEQRKVVVPPEEAYGVREESLIGRVARTELPIEGGVNVGDQFRAGADVHAPVVTVVALEGDEVVLDANHPLAGQSLYFDVEVTAARPATPEEQEQARAATGD
jgi:FKBP-type peptidyl-prolyl cis-trans isomerase SlyD